MDLGFSIQDSGPDVAMLFLAMKLITSPHKPHSSLYSNAKTFLAHFEASGYVSLLVLQAMVFVAAYEYGHAIYPAAWLTVGACSRYAEMLGLGLGRSLMNVLGPMVRNSALRLLQH
jgi:hypothetical protein